MTDFLTDLHDTITAHSVDSQTAKNIVNSIQQLYSGCPIYVQKKKPSLDERNAQIKLKFTGRNHKDLCREFDLSYQSICKIVNGKN